MVIKSRRKPSPEYYETIEVLKDGKKLGITITADSSVNPTVVRIWANSESIGIVHIERGLFTHKSLERRVRRAVKKGTKEYWKGLARRQEVERVMKKDWSDRETLYPTKGKK